MKRLLIFLFLCSVSQAAVITSVGSGDWSAGGTWDSDPAIPVNNDSVVIANGHTVTFDVDQSGFANGIDLQIASGGTLICDTAAGAYYLMMKSDLNNDGTLQAGTSTSVPLPATVTFTIDLNGAFSIQNDATTGSLLLYCTEPTNKYIQLSAAEAAAQTTISVDTDVTSDWAVGDIIVFCDFIPNSTRDVEEHEIAAIRTGPDEIDLVGGGLANAKYDESYVFLRSRNIKIINSTTYAIEGGDSCHIGAEIYDCTYGLYLLTNSTIAGTAVLDNVIYSRACQNTTHTGCYTDLSGSSNSYGLYGDRGSMISSTALLCAGRISYQATAILDEGTSVGSANGHYFGYDIIINGNHYGGSMAAAFSSSIIVTGTTAGMYGASLTYCYDITLSNASIGGTIGGLTTADDLELCGSGRAYNTTFAATTEFNGYDNSAYRQRNDYFESADHDATENAMKAWCLGGAVTSQTTSPPTGYDIWYKLTCEDTGQDYPCFRQYETVVLPGTSIEVEGQFRWAGGEDLSSSGLEPQLQIIDAFADPLVDSAQSPLDYDMPATLDGTETGWQSVDVIWANAGDTQRNVIVRMIAYNDGGVDDVDVNSVWSIATYQDQIADILSTVTTALGTLVPLRTTVAVSDTTTSFTLTAGKASNDAYNYQTIAVQDADDSNWEIRSIEDWTSGRVITVDTAFSFTPAVGDLAYVLGTSYGAPVDLTTITDKLPTNYIMGSDDQDDHNTELEDWEDGGRLDLILDAALADTDELQTDHADGGRLDLIWDAIKKYTDLIVVLETDINDVNDAGNFTVTDGNSVVDKYNGSVIMVQDATDSVWECKIIEDWDTDLEVTLDEDLTFTPESGDLAYIIYIYYGNIWSKIQTLGSATHVIDDSGGAGATEGMGLTSYTAEGDDPH